MTLSSSKLNEIAYLYENVVHGEQEVLGEDSSDAGVNARKFIGGFGRGALNTAANTAKGAADIAGSEFRGAMGQKTTSTNPLARAGNAMTRGARDVAGASLQGLAGQKTTSNNPLAKVDNAITRGISGAPGAVAGFAKGLVTGQGSNNQAASTDYKSKFARPQNAAPGIGNPSGKDSRLDSPTAGRGPKGNEVGSNLHPFKAASGTTPGAAGGGSTPGAKTAPSGPVLSKQGGVEGTGTGANFKAGAWSSADKSRYSAQAAKTTPAASAQNQFAKSNPNLAAAAAERARTRGTQQTDNPLMKDMKSSLPMNSPSVQAPAVAKLGAGNQSLSQNANAFKAASPKPATTAASSAATPGVGQRAAAMPSMGSSQYKATTPSAAIAAAPSTSATASGSVTPATNKIAAMKQQPEVKPQAIAASYEYDAYDLVLEYLLDSGHAESIAEAQYIMTEMDQESIAEIAEGYKKFPTQKVMSKAGKLMGSSAGKNDPASNRKEKRGIKMMDTMMQHTPD